MIYFDNAATTRALDSVSDKVRKCFLKITAILLHRA